jgi:hypothetical protein
MSDASRAKSSGSETRRMQPRIIFRADAELRDKIRMDAAAQGLTVGSYMRWLAGDPRRTRSLRRALPDEKLLMQIKGEVGRVGGNIHQLLRLANRGEIVFTEELADAAKAAREFLEYALELLKRSI